MRRRTMAWIPKRVRRPEAAAVTNPWSATGPRRDPDGTPGLQGGPGHDEGPARTGPDLQLLSSGRRDSSRRPSPWQCSWAGTRVEDWVRGMDLDRQLANPVLGTAPPAARLRPRDNARHPRRLRLRFRDRRAAARDDTGATSGPLRDPSRAAASRSAISLSKPSPSS